MIPIILGVAALIAIPVAIAMRKPDQFRVQRSIRIAAPAAKILPLIEHFPSWTSWSPYEKLDPNLKRTYSGPDRGIGAVYEWEGNSKAGKGRMEIVEATPTRVRTTLEFDRPFKAHNTAEFTLEPAGDGTTVTWAMYGPSPFMTKLMSTVVNMDKLLGRDFETGLANLKAKAEG